METIKKRRIVAAVCIAGMVVGMAIALYPFISDRIAARRNEETVSLMNAVYDRYRDDPKITGLWNAAELYNMKLAGTFAGEVRPYEEQLNLNGDGTMGYLEIACINLKMVIYHGTGEEVLAVGAGHLEGTSLPLGGEGTHTVLTGHSGMNNMKAFDDIRKLEEGDTVTLCTLGRKMNYEVYSVETVLPWETESLKIREGEDLVTLVTCTPYGINDHRLLVHAARTT